MVKQISDKKDVEQIDLLQAFEIIVEKAKGSSLGEEFYQKAEPYLGFVSDKLCISKRASVIMAFFADRCYDTHIRLSDLTEFLDCRIEKARPGYWSSHMNNKCFETSALK